EPLEALHAVSDRKRRPDRALRVVAVGRRRPKDGHDRITDELLDDAAERLELAANEVVVRRQERPHVLRVEHLGSFGEADEVDEHHRNEPSLVTARRRRSRKRLPARIAETRALRVLLAAARTGDHALSLGRGAAIYEGKSGAFGAMTTFPRSFFGHAVCPRRAKPAATCRYNPPFLGVCPSGQRERAVNPSAQPTEVRILPPPPSQTKPRLRNAGRIVR